MMESTVLWCCTRIVNRLGMILSEKERKIGWHRSDADFHPVYAAEIGQNRGLADLHLAPTPKNVVAAETSKNNYK